MSAPTCSRCRVVLLPTATDGVYVCPQCGDVCDSAPPATLFATLLSLIGKRTQRQEAPAPQAPADAAPPTVDSAAATLRAAIGAALPPLAARMSRYELAESVMAAAVETVTGIKPPGGVALTLGIALMGAAGGEATAIAILRMVAAKMRVEAHGGAASAPRFTPSGEHGYQSPSLAFDAAAAPEPPQSGAQPPRAPARPTGTPAAVRVRSAR